MPGSIVPVGMPSMSAQDFNNGFGSCTRPHADSRSGASYDPMTPEEAATLDAEDTLDGEETLDAESSEDEARAAERLRNAREFQLDAELARFVRAAGGTRHTPLKWARNRLID